MSESTLSLINPFLLIAFVSLFSPTVMSSVYNPLPMPSDNAVCGGIELFPVNCPVSCFRADPVCGVDGVTYWCGCRDAICSGTRVAKMGFCEVDGGGNGSVSGQALLLVQIVWLILLGFFVLFGLL